MAIIRKSLDEINQTTINPNELARLNAISDNDIDYSDIPPLSDDDIARAVKGSEVFKFMNNNNYKPIKQQITLRLDKDVLEWLKKDGKGYQTKINDILRNMMMKDIIS